MIKSLGWKASWKKSIFKNIFTFVKIVFRSILRHNMRYCLYLEGKDSVLPNTPSQQDLRKHFSSLRKSRVVNSSKLYKALSVVWHVCFRFLIYCDIGVLRRHLRLITIRYNTLFMCAQKLTNSPLNLPHWTKQKSNEETKKKNRDAHKKRSSHEVSGVSAEDGRESMAGKIYKRGMSWAGSEREMELWVVRVASWQSE